MGCILCVIGVGGGLLFIKKLGIDEYIAAIWLSALNTSLAFYIASRIRRKIPGLRFIFATIFFLITYFYLLKTHQMNHRIFVGMTVGLETYFVAHFLEAFIFRKNNHKSLFKYQKVVVTLVFLLIASLAAALAF